MEMSLQNNFAECVPQDPCSTAQHTPSSSVQTACRETVSLGNAHTWQQTALKNRKHVLFSTHQRPKTALGFFVVWVMTAEIICSSRPFWLPFSWLSSVLQLCSLTQSQVLPQPQMLRSGGCRPA